MTTTRPEPSGIVERAAKIASEVASPAAADVDRAARFPAETFAALRAARMLSALVPTELGGGGASLPEICAAVELLSEQCASSAMIYAMHQMQVACLMRHGRSVYLRDFLRELSREQLLLASATTEVGIGGDLRTSGCAVEFEPGSTRMNLEKQAPVISYGEHSDAILVTARRTPDSPPSDQVLVLCRTSELTLERTFGWDTLGMRGTCSLGFKLQARSDAQAILDDPFGDIASETMLPVSHLLWSSVWQGIAAAAVDRARQFVQAEARRNPGVTPRGAPGLAELTLVYQQFVNGVRAGLADYTPIFEAEGAAATTGLSFAIAFNGLKVSSSRLVVDIVSKALELCGIAGYREDSPFSLGRQLRDAYGASLMVNNDRILANNAQLLLMSKEI